MDETKIELPKNRALQVAAVATIATGLVWLAQLLALQGLLVTPAQSAVAVVVVVGACAAAATITWLAGYFVPAARNRDIATFGWLVSTIALVSGNVLLGLEQLVNMTMADAFVLYRGSEPPTPVLKEAMTVGTSTQHGFLLISAATLALAITALAALLKAGPLSRIGADSLRRSIVVTGSFTSVTAIMSTLVLVSTTYSAPTL